MDRDNLGEDTKIPITWLFALASCSGGILIVAAGLVVWGSRLEAKGDFRESRISKLEIQQDQYGKDLGEIKQALVRIEVLQKLGRRE
jgi:hypothetical protein